MSLELGPLPFRGDTTPYRSPEVRRQRRKRDRLVAKAAAGVLAPPRRVPVPDLAGAEGESLSVIGELSILPDTLAPKDVAFQLGATRDRMRQSVAAAVASHGVGLGVILLLLSLFPAQVYKSIQPNRENYGIVWLPEAGPGGGGGSCWAPVSGHRSPLPWSSNCSST